MFFFQLPWLPERTLGAGGARRIGRAFAGTAIDRSRFPEEVLEVYRAAARRPGALRAMLNWYRAMWRSGFGALLRNVPAIGVPTLMLWGEEDRALGKETTFGTERYVRDLTLRYLPHVSHWVQQEAPEQANAMLEAFLTGRRVPESSELCARS